MRPSATTWITGLARAYNEDYPEQLKGNIKEDLFERIMNSINDQLFSTMPCPLCWILCHLLAIPTLGLSLCFLQSMCITETENNLERRFEHYNKDYLNKVGW